MSVSRRFASTALLIAISFAFSLTVHARTDKGWRPIRPSDLALKDNPASPGSQAMILYHEEDIDSENSIVTEYYRIKIFTAEGEQYGNIEIPFTKGVSSVRDLKARTILPNGTVVEFQGKPFQKVVLKAGGIKMLEDTFSFPNMRPGCIIEYTYQLQYDFRYYWNFTVDVQADLFAREEHFVIKPPRGVGAPGLYTREFELPERIEPVKYKDGSFGFVARNILPLKHEPYMPPASILRGRIQFVIRRERPQSTKNFWNTWAKLSAKSLDRFIDNKGALKNVVAETVGPSDTPLVKLRKLYARAQQIHETDLSPFGTPPAHSEKLKENRNVGDVLKHGYGNGADVNALFIGLARAAGFDASRVFIADRADSVFHPELQDTRELDADIVRVRLAGKDIFLDPASPDYPFGPLPWDESATEGLVIGKKGGEFISVPPTTASQAVTERHAILALDSNGRLSGTVKIDFHGIRGSQIRQEERGKDESDRRQDLQKIVQSWLPSGATFHITAVTGWKHPSAPLHVEGALTIATYGAKVGKRLLIPLVPFVSPEASAFSTPFRVNPIDFYYDFDHRDDITFQLPSVYGVEDLPKPVAANSPPFVYTITAAKQSRDLHVTRDLTVNEFHFQPGYYVVIRDVFSRVKRSDDNQAVLESGIAATRR